MPPRLSGEFPSDIGSREKLKERSHFLSLFTPRAFPMVKPFFFCFVSDYFTDGVFAALLYFPCRRCLPNRFHGSQGGVLLVLMLPIFFGALFLLHTAIFYGSRKARGRGSDPLPPGESLNSYSSFFRFHAGFRQLPAVLIFSFPSARRNRSAGPVLVNAPLVCNFLGRTSVRVKSSARLIR